MPDSFAWTYAAFGLSVGSDLELDGFVPTEAADAPDATVTLGRPEGANDGGNCVLARADGILEASIKGGRDIVVSPSEDVDTHFLSAVVTGELFSVILRQRGLLVLHGSAVEKDGVAVGFVGDSGWGKSTLAASLVDRGWRLLTDDLLVIDPKTGDGAPDVVPTHPMMRLSQEALDRVEGGVAQGQAHARTTKLRVDQAAVFSDARAQLANIWILDPRLTDDHASEPLTGLHAVHEMVRHTRGRRLLNAKAAKATLLQQCADIAHRVPVAALRRRFGLEHVASLCDLVESEARS